jgi:hypothetical protein
LKELSINWGKSAIFATYNFRGFTGGTNGVIRRPMGGFQGWPEGGLGRGVQLDDIGWLTGLFPGGPRGTLGAPGDDSPCPGNWRG